MANTFSDVVRGLRKISGLRLAQVASRVGIQKGYMSGIETGKVNPPTVKVVLRIARVFKGVIESAKYRVSDQDWVELAWVSKSPKLVRQSMMSRLSHNALAMLQLEPPVRHVAPMDIGKKASTADLVEAV